MTHDEQGEALLSAILDEPTDDAGRLVYADWMEENGQDERAEFVRCQVALVKLETDPRQNECATPGPECSDPACPMKQWMRDEASLHRRERELLLLTPRPGIASRGWYDWCGPAAGLIPEGTRFDDHVTFRRGFVESVRCPLDAWRRHGPAIVRAHPVQTVSITDKEPDHEEDGLYHWYFYDPADEPDSLPGYLQCRVVIRHPEWTSKTREGATNLLSVACLKWAKREAFEAESARKASALLAIAKELASTFDAPPP